MPLVLRDYQHAAIDAIEAKVRLGVRRPAVVLPTGAGKTAVFSHYVDRPETRRRGRSLVLAHREELISQAVDKIMDANPHLRVGIVKGTTNQIGADVIVGSVQTLRHPARRARVRGIGTIIVDECHHATAPSYRDIARHYGALGAPGDRLWTPPEGGAVMVGFTATLSRSDGASLGDVWQDVAYHRDIASMIAEGYLVRPRAVRVEVPELHLERVRKSHGDFADGALGEALEGSLAPERVAEAYIEHAGDRQGILFAPTVSASYAFAQALEAAGLTVGVVHGALPITERRERLEEFRLGKIQVLCNCMVLTEGTDLPMAAVVVVARPTRNRGLFIQMAGRGLRLHPGKTEALILIVAGASEAHQLIAPVELFGEEAKAPKEKPEIEFEPGELGLLDDEAGEGDAVTEQIYHHGPVIFTEIDLFASSSASWQRTYAGVWFTRDGERLIAILPAVTPGEFDVLWMHHATPGQSGWISRGVRDLRHAMNAAENNTSRSGANPIEQLSTRYSVERQAARCGLAVTRGMSLGEARTLISVALASVRIDPGLPAHLQRG